MLNSQLSYISKKFKNVSDLNHYRALNNDFKVIILPFYKSHEEEKPTEAECRQILNILEEENAEDYSMIVVYESYKEANADVPELELEYPRIKAYYDKAKALKPIEDVVTEHIYDRCFGDD